MKRLLLALVIPLFFTQIVTAQTDREILRLGRGTANALDWRPDGEVLAVGSGTGVWLYDEDFETLAHLEDEQTGNVQTVKWSPAGDRLASANDTGTMQIWNVADDLQGEVCSDPNGLDIKSRFVISRQVVPPVVRAIGLQTQQE